MRFVSPYRKHQIAAIKEEWTLRQTQNGPTPWKTKDGVILSFQQGVLMPHEIEAALKHFNLRGVAYDEKPERRFSVVDTEALQIQNKWPDELRQEIEQILLSKNDVLHVPRVQVPKPWPTYDEFADGPNLVKRIIDTLRLIGADAELAVRYEREHLNRADVVEALEREAEQPAAEPAVVVNA